MSYQEKLVEFNATDKYHTEMMFLIKKVNPSKNDKILDYGCGTGKMVKQILGDHDDLKCFGYDVQNLRTGEDARDEYTFKREFHFQMNKIYFMHSIAHIPTINITLQSLYKTFLEQSGEIHVLTPNRLYLNELKGKEYVPDPTVVQHYSIDELVEIFESNLFKVKDKGYIGERINGHFERVYIKVTK